jgi:hypothetical protein
LNKSSEIKYCECGCGQIVKCRFVSGHNARVVPPSRKGRVAWNKGLKMTKEQTKNFGKHSIGNSFASGWVPSEETRKLWSEQRKGRKAWNKGLTYKTKPCPEWVAKKISLAHKKRWKDPEFAARRGREWQIKPNKPETFILNILNELYPNEWKYTGDFSFTINGKCPDFVNCNGQKKIIELFGDYWHDGDDPQDRINIFKPFGYDTLVIWEHELKDIDSVKSLIKKFSEKRNRCQV